MHTDFAVKKTWAYNPESKMFNGAATGKELYHLMEFDLLTGKKHQIRLNCSYALNAPIIGDRKYGYV